MGAWGTGSFENDDALDLMGDLLDGLDESGGKSAFKQLGIIFRDALSEDNAEYLEAPDGTSAIAAGELLAAALGKPAKDLPESATEWLEAIGDAKPAAGMVQHAVEAITAVLERDTSELRELWADAAPADYKTWQDSVKDLLRRLS